MLIMAPANGPAVPAAIFASTSAAFARAVSSNSSKKMFRSASVRASRSAARVISTTVVVPDANAALAS